MYARNIRIVAILIFIALLATPMIIRRMKGGSAAGRASSVDQPLKGGDPQVAFAQYGFHLEEISKRVGINFVHEAPTLDKKLEHIMPEIASMGAAVSIVDFDKDGYDDIYVTNSSEGGQNHLYRNNHDGTYTDVASRMGIADVNKPGTGVSMGAVWGDYDNDGYEDLLLYKWGKPELFHNDKGKGFTNVTAEAGLPAWVNANNAIWLDYDNDGKLDLLICGYYPENVDLWHLKTTKMMPESFEYANNGGRKYLMHNLGNGHFEDVTQKMGLNSHRWTLAAVAADLRGTGYPDIFLANDYGVPELFANEKGKMFREVGRACGIAEKPKSGMNAAIGDIFNQGTEAVYVSNISEPPILMQGNNLFVPRPGTSGDAIQYDNPAHDLGLELGGWSFGAQFGDLNNDGFVDLYLTNGFYSGDKKTKDTYWYDFSTISGGNTAIISDAKNWPPVMGRSHAGNQPKHIWINDGSGKFIEVAQAVGVTDLYDGRSVALGDFRNNGMLDVLVANEKGPLLFYQNTVNPTNGWIEFDLEGTKSNRSAIGTRVELHWSGQKQVQEVSGGSGFCAQNMRRLHFGLGKSVKLEKAIIHWPSGTVQTLTSLDPDKIIHVKEPQ